MSLVNGQYSPLVEEQVVKFQVVNGLKGDKLVGRQTYAALAGYEHLPPPHLPYLCGVCFVFDQRHERMPQTTATPLAYVLLATQSLSSTRTVRLCST